VFWRSVGPNPILRPRHQEPNTHSESRNDCHTDARERSASRQPYTGGRQAPQQARTCSTPLASSAPAGELSSKPTFVASLRTTAAASFTSFFRARRCGPTWLPYAPSTSSVDITSVHPLSKLPLTSPQLTPRTSGWLSPAPLPHVLSVPQLLAAPPEPELLAAPPEPASAAAGVGIAAVSAVLPPPKSPLTTITAAPAFKPGALSSVQCTVGVQQLVVEVGG
jgi:hypothetical protein